MPDNKRSTGNRDRSRVAASEDYEVRHVAEKLDVSTQQVTGAIRAVGNKREDVEKYIKDKKKSGR
jgi:hypothetical protein